MAAPRGVSTFRPEPLWQQAREPLFWLDSSLRLSWVNRAWEEATGHAGASVLGLTCAPIGPEESGEADDLAISLAPPAEAVRGEPSGMVTLIARTDGPPAWKRVEFWPFSDRDGKLLGLLGQLREREAPCRAPDAPSHRLRLQLLELRERLRRSHQLESLLGTGPAHDRLLEQARLASSATAPVLIVGEPGTGKKLVARVIHSASPLRDRPFIPLDCEALPAEVIERELRKVAELECPPPRASDGSAGPEMPAPGHEGVTLLIGDLLALPRDLQQRLAQIVRESRQVRVIATTTGEPSPAVVEGRLRDDLYHAVSVIALRTLPLRDRLADLPVLVQQLLERINHRTASYCGGLDPRALDVLEAHDWPGNIRELERVLNASHERARLREGDGAPVFTIEITDLPPSIRGNLGAAYLPPAIDQAVKPLDELLTEIERRLIETALSRARQNKSRAAEFLGISRPRLYRRIKELNLPDDGEPEPEPQPATPPAAH